MEILLYIGLGIGIGIAIGWLYAKLKTNGGVFAPSKKKKVWFNPNSEYSPCEKQSISAKIIAGEKAKKTIGKLEGGVKRLIQNHPKVTQKMLALETGKSLGTVKRYWNRLKDLIK